MSRAEFERSELLTREGFRHAFFTRRGGVSEGPFRALNFSQSVGDDPENVRENLTRAARELGVDPGSIYYLSQVHGRHVVELDRHASQQEIVRIEGDAVLSSDPIVACGVRSADCVPVLIADRRSGAVAAVHAGWRGSVAGVVRSAVESLAGRGGSAADFVAAIGPHISVEAFEVSEDVALTLQGVVDDSVIDRSYGPKPHVNLRRLCRASLRNAGLRDEAIDDVMGCTVREPERFFSYRRDGARSGRHLSAIVARG